MQTRKQNAGFWYSLGNFRSKTGSAITSESFEGGEIMTSRSRKQIVCGLIAFIVVTLALTSVVSMPASAPKLGTNWRVQNIEPATNFLWNIDRPQFSITGGLLQFPVQQFDTVSTGSFVVYLLNNYNYDLTGSTLTADAMWTSGTYKTRSTTYPGAYVRFVLSSKFNGNWTPNDYWWSTGSDQGSCSGTNLDLNGCTDASGTLNASLADRAEWTNICGKPATDTNLEPDCITGGTMTVTPSEGFTNALKNVKVLGLSFGSSGSYASGIALDGEKGGFYLNDFTVTPPTP